MVAIAGGAAMARHMLDRGKHPSSEQTFGGGAAQFSNNPGIGGKRPVTDDRTCTGELHIENGQAADINPDTMEIGGDQAGIEPGSAASGSPIALSQCTDRAGRGRFAPMRRAHTDDPAAFLIDQNRSVGAIDGRP